MKVAKTWPHHLRGRSSTRLTLALVLFLQALLLSLTLQGSLAFVPAGETLLHLTHHYPSITNATFDQLLFNPRKFKPDGFRMKTVSHGAFMVTVSLLFYRT